MKLTHEFVEFIPTELRDGILYVSVAYATATHRCCCGCGSEVVTPLTPTDWKMIFDGQTVSLDPSIGNWSFPCRSHYWVRRNRVRWAGSWSREEVEVGRARDRAAKARQFEADAGPDVADGLGGPPPPPLQSQQAVRSSVRARLLRWWADLVG